MSVDTRPRRRRAGPTEPPTVDEARAVAERWFEAHIARLREWRAAPSREKRRRRRGAGPCGAILDGLRVPRGKPAVTLAWVELTHELVKRGLASGEQLALIFETTEAIADRLLDRERKRFAGPDSLAAVEARYPRHAAALDELASSVFRISLATPDWETRAQRLAIALRAQTELGRLLLVTGAMRPPQAEAPVAADQLCAGLGLSPKDDVDFRRFLARRAVDRTADADADEDGDSDDGAFADCEEWPK